MYLYYFFVIQTCNCYLFLFLNKVQVNPINIVNEDMFTEVCRWIRLIGRFLLCCVVKLQSHHLNNNPLHVPHGQEVDFDFKFLELTETGHIKEESLLFSKTTLWNAFAVREIDFDDRYVVISYARLHESHCEIRCISTGTPLMDMVVPTQISYLTPKMVLSNGLIFVSHQNSCRYFYFFF